MEVENYVRAILALVFVVGLIGLCSVLARKYLVEKQFGGAAKKQKRLSVEEICVVDAKRRLVLIKRDNVEHLVLFGTSSDLLIEKEISNSNNINPEKTTA